MQGRFVGYYCIESQNYDTRVPVHEKKFLGHGTCDSLCETH